MRSLAHPVRATTVGIFVVVAALAASLASAAPGMRSGFAPSRTLDVRSPVDAIAADGSRVAFASGGEEVDVWDVRTSKLRHAGNHGGGISFLAVAGDVVGYLGFEYSNTLQFRTVETYPLVKGKGFWVQADLRCARTCLGYVAGHGDLLVYNSWQNARQGTQKAVLWRIVGRRSVAIIRGAGSLYAAAVDGGRIVVRRPPRDATLVSEAGSILTRYRFTQPVRTIRLAGHNLVALLPRTIVVLEATTGALKESWRVPKHTRLEDVAGRLVVYTEGRRIHLRRLADGRDRVIPLPKHARAPVHAQLEPSGLFYSWTPAPAPGDKYGPHGRLAFAPMARVARLF